MVTQLEAIRTTNRRSNTNMLDNPVGRTLLVMMNAALSGMVFLLFFLFSRPMTALPLKYAVVGIVGLTAGLTARRLLGHNTGVLRLMAAITASFTGLIVLNIFSSGFVGIDLAPRGVGNPDWDGLIQIGAGTLCAILTLQAWKYKKPEISAIEEPRERRRLRLLPGRMEDWLERASLRISGASSSGQRSGGSRVSLRTHSSANGNAGRSSLVKRQRRPKVFAWARRQHANQVHLDTKEEHRCPFCLEVVDENDPRGIKICPICHTYHHADCWDVTGMCQIPHIQD
jgi:ribosomal protein L37AE/L43A